MKIHIKIKQNSWSGDLLVKRSYWASISAHACRILANLSMESQSLYTDLEDVSWAIDAQPWHNELNTIQLVNKFICSLFGSLIYKQKLPIICSLCMPHQTLFFVNTDFCSLLFIGDSPLSNNDNLGWYYSVCRESFLTVYF